MANADNLDLKQVRLELGVTQEGFAELLGRSVHTVRLWEQGRGSVPKPLKKLIDRILIDHRAARKAAA